MYFSLRSHAWPHLVNVVYRDLNVANLYDYSWWLQSWRKRAVFQILETTLCVFYRVNSQLSSAYMTAQRLPKVIRNLNRPLSSVGAKGAESGGNNRQLRNPDSKFPRADSDSFLMSAL